MPAAVAHGVMPQSSRKMATRIDSTPLSIGRSGYERNCGTKARPVLFVFLFGHRIQPGLFRCNDGAVQCLGLIDHHAGNLIARLNRLQAPRRRLGGQLNLLQRTLRG